MRFFRRRRIRSRTASKYLFRTVLLAIFLVVGGGLGLKFYINHKVKSQLDEVVESIALIGSLTYGSVSSDYEGRIFINDLSFFPRSGDIAPVTIEQIRFKTPGIGYLAGFGRDEIPRSMSLSAANVKMSLYDIVALNQDQEFNNVTLNPFEAMGCGETSQFTLVELTEMGYDEDAIMNIRADYEYRSFEDEVVVSFVLDTPGVDYLDTQIVFSTPNLEDVVQRQVIPEIGLSEVRIEFDSSAFNRRRNSYCALQQNLSRVDAIEENIAESLQTMRESGYEPSAELIEQYRTFISGDGSWVFSSLPTFPVSLTDLAISGGKPEDAFSRLKFQASIGDHPTTPVEMQRVALNDEGIWEVFEPGTEQEQEQPLYFTGWLDITPDKASRYIGNRVSITTLQKQSYTGVLLDVNSDEVRIETRREEGIANLPISTSKISELSVYLRRVKRSELEAG